MLKRCLAFLILLHLYTILPAQVYHFKTGKVLPFDEPGLVDSKPGVFNSYPAEFSVLITHENYSKKKSRLITLPVIRIKSFDQDSSSFPIFVLYGGPGESNLKPELINDNILRYHDIVLVGYRGVDGSIKLNCDNVKNTLLHNDLTIENSNELFINGLESCINQLEKNEVDIKGYTVDAVTDDIEKVRNEFNYADISFLAFSYGTVVAQKYALKFPNKVSKMFLIGARPHNNLYIDAEILENQLVLFESYFGNKEIENNRFERERIINNNSTINGDINTTRYYIYLFSQLYTVNELNEFFAYNYSDFQNKESWSSKNYTDFYESYPGELLMGDMYLKKQNLLTPLRTKFDSTSVGFMANQINNWYSPQSKYLLNNCKQEEDKVDIISTQIYFLSGELDVASPPELIKNALNLYPNSYLEILNRVGHLDFFFTQKSITDSLINNFYLGN